MPYQTKLGVKYFPLRVAVGDAPPAKMKWLERDNRIWWGQNGDADFPMEKKFLKEAKSGVVNQTWWPYTFAGSTRNAGAELKEIFGGEKTFETPKPRLLIERILELSCDNNAVILDSFAGSATTAHAVIAANEKDGGTRRFILVEMEDYAERLTAERVRRVINGYEFQGTKKEELWRKKITFTSLKKATALLDKVQAIKNIHEHKFDAIKSQIKDDQLVVTGEKQIQERVEGLGGSFTYCTLGDPIDMDDILTGKKLPDYQNLGAWLFHTATGEPLEGTGIDESKWYLGESSQFHVWLVYRPDLGFLKSREAALTLDLAETISATGKDKKHLVFAPARFVPNKTLLPMGVEHLPLPYALYRVNNA